jgi:organic hydroperoxide reductase OsmC/OhrA
MGDLGATAIAHRYVARLVWTGNLGTGTSDYTSYDRGYRVIVEGKPELVGSAHRAYRGDPARHDPEDLFLAAISACHMLSYLSLYARRGGRVLSYEDEARGMLAVVPGGGGRFAEVMLRPSVTVAPGADEALALALHDVAHDRCFIANSCSVPIRHEATVRIGEEAAPAGDGA